MAIKIEMLRCFHSVVDHGNLAQAAEALGRTPSAVSMMLKQFEDHIGAPLFEKGRKARLTALGQMIHAEARRELVHFDKSVTMIDALATSQAGLVRLAVTPSAANTVLPAVISRFASNHPGVRIDLRDMDSTAVLHAMQSDQADIGIATLPDTAGLQRWPLFADHFGVVCRADHPLANDWNNLTWADVVAHRFIANGLCHMIKDAQFAPILAASLMTVPTTVSLLALVNAGVGVTLLPERALPPTYRDLVFLPLKDSTAQRQVDVVTQPLPQLSPAVQAFAKLLQDF
ncbi:LysR substrate-binding domain-containing protein [Pseudosulfitobacter sp. SM2401]|uniref:LysR family transcriptional regulator n=1 Tax=Pseudosulfitobacter sp. SM2401 TaxID=3350098 RepID=UPI0036F3CE87